jgi:uncharacterized protein YecE (DUF72 family)
VPGVLDRADCQPFARCRVVHEPRQRVGPVVGAVAVDEDAAAAVLDQLREHRVAWEPRHASWFEPAAEEFLAAHLVARVAADPAPVPAAEAPGGSPDFRYYRLHGSPRTYHSPYPREFLEPLAERLRAETVETWCIFDNTASGAALGNALDVRELLAE